MGDEHKAPRRTKWDTKADAARTDLVADGIARLLEDGLGAIAGLVSPSALARRSEAMSVDRAYRLLGDPESTLRRIVTHAADPHFRSDVIGWPTFDEVSSAAVAEAATGTDLEATTAAVRHYVEQNFRLPSYPLGRIIAAVTLTASPAWQGPITVSDELRELAEEFAESARRGALAMQAHMRWLLLDSLGALRRRPRPGMTLDLIVELALALANGSLDRMFVDPSRLTVEQVVDALVTLTIALTEEGPLDDPRVPTDAVAAAAFTSLVRAAEAHWRAGGTIPDLDAVVGLADTHGTEVATWFSSVSALADSVLRSRLAGRESKPGAPVTMIGLLRADLRRVAETADAMPEVVRLAAAVEPGCSVLNELLASAAACAAELRTDGRLAEQLVATACLGTAHWPTTEVLLDVLVAP